jgi:hypothetical protein
MTDIQVTVGTSSGDFVGTTHRALQAAVDYVASFGGGMVRILPGTYHMANALHLCDHLRLVGSGADTILLKDPSCTTPLVDDTDWYDWHAVVRDPACFEVGGGILLRARDPHGGATNYSKHTVISIDGNVIRLDSQPRKNMWITHEATASTLYPIVTGNWVKDVQIRDLVLDGNRENNEHLDGNYGGCIFIQDCERVHISKVITRNNNGDGISWQICHDVTVERCASENNRDLGLHPGSGSRRPVIRQNQIHHCRIGIFWCWGVKGGLAEDNEIRHCQEYGISIGHRDTDNIVRRNRVYNAGKAGLYFRPEEPATRSAHRNVIEGNLFQDTGTSESPGIGIDLAGAVDGTVLSDNHIVNSCEGHTSVGIHIGSGVTNLTLSGNEYVNVSRAVHDERKADTR